MIERIQGKFEGRNKAVAYKDLVFTVATASDDTLGFEEQTIQTLKTLEVNLEELNSSKKQILSAQVYISDMNNKKRWMSFGASGLVIINSIGPKGLV